MLTVSDRRCLESKNRACAESSFVKFMMDHLEKIGCKVQFLPILKRGPLEWGQPIRPVHAHQTIKLKVSNQLKP